MACKLTISTTLNEHFLGATGVIVTVKLKGPEGSGAEIVHVRYAGDAIDSEAPFQFTIQQGPNMLVVLAEATASGALLQLIEDCGGGSEQVLREFRFDPENPARGFIVRGQ